MTGLSGAPADSAAWLRQSSTLLRLAGAARPRIAARLFNRPLLLHGPVARLIAGNMLPVLADGGGPFLDGDESGDRPSRRGLQRRDGVAVIDVTGELVHDTHGAEPRSGLLPYQAIAADLNAALDDPDTRAILFRVDSPGGEVAGVFDLADAVRAADAVKPTAAIAADLAASAGYLLASAAGRVFVTQSAKTGSVGVVATLWDRSAAQAAAGIKVTLIQAGARKTDGHPDKPLDDPAHAAIQAEVDRIMDLFADKVAAYRGIAPEAVRAWEAGIFVGADAITAGLADAVTTEDQALAWLRGIGAGNADPLAAARIGQSRGPEIIKDRQTQEGDMNRTMKAKANTPAAMDEDEDDAKAMDEEDEDAKAMDEEDEEEEAKDKRKGKAKTSAGARRAGYAEAAEVVQLCQLAGHPDRAAGFLARGLGRAAVQAALLAEREAVPAVATSPVARTTAAAAGKGFLAARMRASLQARGIDPEPGLAPSQMAG